MLYEVESLAKARADLAGTEEKVVLSNPDGSTRYYGMRVLDYIFKTLQKEFPDKIQRVIVNAFDDYSAFVTAREIGYRDIQFINSL